MATPAIMVAVSPSLREQHRARTTAAITAAALELFADRGYPAVTVSEVAAAAGVAQRTLYRYFADKDDLLFAEDEQLRAGLRSAIEQQPHGRPAFAVLRQASAAVADVLEDRREEIARRAQIIASSPALTARERAKHATWESDLAHGLSQRGVAPPEAGLLGRIAVACYAEALTRWLAHDDAARTLNSELDATFTQLGALVEQTGPRLRSRIERR